MGSLCAGGAVGRGPGFGRASVRLIPRLSGMNRIALCIAAFVAFGVGFSVRLVGAPLTVQLLHASDFEAGVPALDDIPRFSSVLNALREGFAGETILLSSGDNYIAGPFFTASADPAAPFNGVRGRGDIAILNALGFQASCIGNHEFDVATDQIRKILIADVSANYAGTQFPYLAVNLDFAADPSLANLVVADGQDASAVRNKISGSVILSVAGQRIGVVGAITKDLNSLATTGDVVVSTDLVGKIQPAVDGLVAQGVNKVVLVSHLQDFRNEFDLATKLRGVDVIVAGGSHAVFAKPGDRVRDGDLVANTYPAMFTSAKGEPVYVVNTGPNYRYVGRLIVTFDDSGLVTGVDDRSGAYAADEKGVLETGSRAATPAVVEIVKNLGGILDSKDGNLFGRTTQFLDGRSVRVRSEETNLGDLCTDAYLWYARQSDPATVIGFIGGGGIRDSIGGYTSAGGHAEMGPPLANPRVGKKDGDISQLDIEDALRFNNGLSLLTVTAQQLRDCLEWGVSASGAAGRYPHVSGVLFSYVPTNNPMTYVIGDDGRPARIDSPGERVRNLVVLHPDERQDLVVERGVLVGDPNRKFRLVTIDYTADGGDSYLPLTQATERVDLFVADSAREFNLVGRQQLTLAQYLKTIGQYNEPERPASEDQRNQNLSKREDSVLSPILRRVDVQPSSTRLTFRTLQGRRYVAESMETLGGAWVRLPKETQGTGALAELVDTRASGAQRYYRVVMLP